MSKESDELSNESDKSTNPDNANQIAAVKLGSIKEICYAVVHPDHNTSQARAYMDIIIASTLDEAGFVKAEGSSEVYHILANRKDTGIKAVQTACLDKYKAHGSNRHFGRSLEDMSRDAHNFIVGE